LQNSELLVQYLYCQVKVLGFLQKICQGKVKRVG
jgi:hypothetical protein